MLASLSLFAALTIGQSEPPPIKGLVTQLPKAQPATIAGTEQWTLRRLPVAPEPPVELNKRRVKVEGKWVTIRPTDNYEYVDRVQPAPDGSLLITRGHRQSNWSSMDSIWYRGKESQVAYGDVQIYRDRLNYAGSRIRETNAIGMPESAPEGYLVEAGVYKPLGWGSVRHWGNDGLLVLEVPVDRNNNPSGTEFTAAAITRLLWPGGEQALRNYGFLGREKDGTVTLVSSPGASSIGNGFINLGQEDVPNTRVLRWREGQILSHWEVPKGWEVSGFAPTGWILLRRSQESSGVEPALQGGEKPEEVMAAMNRAMDRDQNAQLALERDWSAGILRDGKVTVVSVKKPSDAGKLLWRGGAISYGESSYRFGVFYGDASREYLASRPAPHSGGKPKP